MVPDGEYCFVVETPFYPLRYEGAYRNGLHGFRHSRPTGRPCAVHTVFAAILVGGGVFLALRFRQVADWYDRRLRTLADGPRAPEPERRGVLGQWAMVGTGSSTTARWYRRSVTLIVGLAFLIVGVGALFGAWRV
jgi:hypothetical protein